MSRAKRQKTDLAAYAASQPLFEALRNARDTSLNTQAVNLTVARDVVKTIHVGIRNDDEHNNIERHITYMDAIVEAWRSATDAYCDIFSKLTTLTAEKPNEGIGAAESHGVFKEMLDTAQRAQESARKFTLAKERPELHTAAPEDEMDIDPFSVPASDDEIEVKVTPTTSSHRRTTTADTSTATPGKLLARPDKYKLDKSGTRVLWDKGASKPLVPLATLSSSEKKEWLVEQARQKRDKQKSKAHEIRLKQQRQEPFKKPSALADDHNSQLPGVDYEDLSAEVEARIKAKNEAKKAKKHEKKRKRESKDSFVNVNTFEGDDEEDTIVVATHEKPSKKKLKHSSEEGTPVVSSAPQTGNSTPVPDSDTILVGKKEKRKQQDGDEIVVKKRKKSN